MGDDQQGHAIGTAAASQGQHADRYHAQEGRSQLGAANVEVAPGPAQSEQNA